MQEHKIGNVVFLKPSGPDMNIHRIVGTDSTFDQQMSDDFYGYKKGYLVCRWFEGDKLQSSVFSPDQVSFK